MTLLITLPKTTEQSLREAAQKQKVSPEILAAQILEDALFTEGYPGPEEVIAKIMALPPDPQDFRPPTASLLELLENAPEDPDFDLAEWQRQWASVEEELKAITEADNVAEGLNF